MSISSLCDSPCLRPIWFWPICDVLATWKNGADLERVDGSFRAWCFESCKAKLHISNQIFQEERKSTNLTIYCIFLNLEFADRINCICNSLRFREKGNKKNFQQRFIEIEFRRQRKLEKQTFGSEKSEVFSQKLALWILSNQTQMYR